GFTLTTDCCGLFYQAGRRWPPGLEKQVQDNLKKLERVTKKRFGAGDDPLLVSVRSGAALSMPGMMETILNLGLNDESVEALGRQASNRRFALDAYRRLIMMYGATARGIDRAHFDRAFDEIKEQRTRLRLGVPSDQMIKDTDVNEQELDALIEAFKNIYAQHTGEPFPQDPYTQLVGSIDAVFGSWMADKAVTYRRVEKITGLKGTAVNVCQMVFGNMGDDCGTGVCFTRDPSTGENVYYGDLLMNAQGEDVVAGVRTPVKLAELAAIMPEVYDQLEAVRAMLEVHYREMQDLEFTIERGKLFILQCRIGKRSPAATFKIAVDHATKPVIPAVLAKRLAKKRYLSAAYAKAAAKPVIAKDEAIARIKPEDIERLFYPIIDASIERSELERRLLGTGINAVPGAACGEVAFGSEQAERRAAEGRKVILVCKETSPEDVGGMHAAVGILTATGGKTSHAAVVARGWGKCCIVGCEKLNVDLHNRTMSINGRMFNEGDSLTLDGGTGEIFDGQLDLARPQAPPEYDMLMSWCDRRRRLQVRANADTPEDAQRAVSMGAEAIGLCRTEHMFFAPSEPQRLRAMREMILASDRSDRQRALDKLLPFQRGDFEGIFEAMDGKPVTIRLLDPPLHEFLPGHDNPQAQQEAADDLNAIIRAELKQVEDWDQEKRQQLECRLVTLEEIRHRVDQLHEANPMLGHRGCRLCITYPEILEMQVRAIIDAAVACRRRGIKVRPEIMIPLSIDGKELDILIKRTHRVARERLVLAFGGDKEVEKLNALIARIAELSASAADAPQAAPELSEARAQRDNLLTKSKSPAKLPYLVGTMIETPRAAVTADRIAQFAEFFSFGTNDLTQTTMALSRDDAGRFLHEYVDQDRAAIFKADPFESLDVEGVGELVRMGIEKGRSTKPKLKVGICGEHGGELNSIRFCHSVGMDYVSCSPYRVPIARLAAAQAAIDDRDGRARIVARTTARSRTARNKPAQRTKTKSQAKARAKKTKKAQKTGRRR
ncbi:MAG: putative PEP-binding protein, partial [Planctomycetota bacterium]